MTEPSLGALRQGEVANAIPSSESFDDLEALLAESTQIATATKLQKQGRQLTTAQKELLEANKIAAEIERWEAKAVYAHICHVYCECGSFVERFRGWYQYQEQKYGRGRRLLKTPDHDDLPASRYTTEETVRYCSDCLEESELPEAEVEECDLLQTLGIAASEAGPDVPDDLPSIDAPPEIEHKPKVEAEELPAPNGVEVEEDEITGELEE